MLRWQEWANTPTVFDDPELAAAKKRIGLPEIRRRADILYRFRVRRRIKWLLAELPRLGGRKRAHAYYVLAVLHYRIGMHPETQNARAARFYAIRAVRLDGAHHRAWDLLAELYDLLAAQVGVGCRLKPTADGRWVEPVAENPSRAELVRRAAGCSVDGPRGRSGAPSALSASTRATKTIDTSSTSAPRCGTARTRTWQRSTPAARRHELPAASPRHVISVFRGQPANPSSNEFP